MITTQPMIYVVDDDQSVRKALKRLMTSAGFAVEVFACAQDFLDSRHQDKPGCLVLDVRMPGMNGLELQQQLLSSGSKIPTIFITAHEDKKVRDTVMKAGAIACLMKPFEDQVLFDAISTGLKQLGGGKDG